DPFFVNELADSNGNLQGSPGDPRDFRIEVLDDDGGRPGSVLFSLDVTDYNPYAPQTSNFLNFLEFDVTQFAGLNFDQDVLYVAISDIGADDNNLILGLSTYTDANSSFLYGPFQTGPSWLPLWDLSAGTVSFQDRSIPIRAQFRSGIPTDLEDKRLESTPGLTATIFPNPSHTNLTLQIVVPGSGPLEVDIVDILGRVIARDEVSDLTFGTHRLVYDVSAWAQGVYLVTVRTRDSATQVSAVVAR
ncbi:MAG: T9SS type A sorting domain-containing protein, partial [Rhodothermales bacterium]|nr:T9SS type A sorting domain-containing protein [Rhodothermales bacterium]